MAYQPIVAESEVNDALERLESILGIEAVIDVSGGDATAAKKREVTIPHDKHGFWARHENRYGDRKAVTLGLIGADDETCTIAIRSKEDGDPWRLAGLFVSDSEGNRWITHSGRFAKRYHHKTFRDHTGPDGWIDVDVEGGERGRFLVSKSTVSMTHLSRRTSDRSSEA